MGGESHLHVRLEGSDQLAIVNVPGRPDFVEAAPLSLYVRVSDLHPFNRASGRRTD